MGDDEVSKFLHISLVRLPANVPRGMGDDEHFEISTSFFLACQLCVCCAVSAVSRSFGGAGNHFAIIGYLPHLYLRHRNMENICVSFDPSIALFVGLPTPGVVLRGGSVGHSRAPGFFVNFLEDSVI